MRAATRALPAILAASLCCTAMAQTQPVAPPSQPPAEPAPNAPPPRQAPGEANAPDQPQQTQFADLPEPVRLGVRIELLRRRIPVIPTLVLVPDTRSYIEAIAAWTLEGRFPILIDDGSHAARENIARFVRSFEPASIVRWSAKDAKAPLEDIRGAVEQAFAASWGAESYADLPALFAGLGFAPPGVVVAAPGDTAWPAALALAAGHGQPIVWLGGLPRNPGGVMPQAQGDDMDQRLRDTLAAISLPWDSLGDAIDSIALCLNTPIRFESPGGMLATTDRIGRHPDGARYAWAGQIHGGEAEAAWRAMCSLFLRPTRAFLFDSYKNEEPFSLYGVADAAEMLTKAGFETQSFDPEGIGLIDWRALAIRPFSADLLIVNTAGNGRFFEMPPGEAARGSRGFASDLPMLLRPAVVHYIHSFSAQNLADREGLARRWLEQGACAYVGSVDEPFLTSFQPPISLAARFLAPAPLAAAARIDTAPIWKIAVIGDPLLIVAAPSQLDRGAAGRIDAEPPLPGATDVGKAMADALREKRFEDAMSALIIQCRDEQAARLFEAVAHDEKASLSPRLARIAFPALFRAGRGDLVLRAFLAMDEGAASDTLVIDALWQAMRPQLEKGEAGALVIDTLKRRVRETSLGDDGVLLARSAERLGGPAAATLLLSELAQRAADDRQLRILRKELSRLGG